ncbi:tetratricopeptide repeat protein [Allorhizocola rhizosphaerae]|uniref:tetratricopeptide repeat protein n=1 Tax=Allorhizocola rhizosphaerae TaxID=1872709 RepID=UPI0013C2AA98|nr:tetratricopeptide repeat protein [Allorhizocola rhizosphaerae]
MARSIDVVGPHTVLWLNELQHYLLNPNAISGERIAAGLRALLSDTNRAPVLVLGTMWPEVWQQLTAMPSPGQPDPHSQARELLAGRVIFVPETFSEAERARVLAVGADARLRDAAQHGDRRITQYLAGAPELMARYRAATPETRAVLHVAMDARRLGSIAVVPYGLLERAVPSYLTDDEWARSDADWLETALAYAARPSRGTPGLLARVQPRPGDRISGPAYRLADYLEQVGGIERAGVVPPAAFWDAVSNTITDIEGLRRLGFEAQRRGRFQRASQIYRQAAELGDVVALRELAVLQQGAGNSDTAHALAREAAERGDPSVLGTLALLRAQSEDRPGAMALYHEAIDRGDDAARVALANLLVESGDRDTAEHLFRVAADLGDTSALGSLAKLLAAEQDLNGALELANLAAERGDASGFSAVAKLQMEVGDFTEARSLAELAAEHGDSSVLISLAQAHSEAGQVDAAEQLAWQAAQRDEPAALTLLAVFQANAGDWASAWDLATWASERGDRTAMRTVARCIARAGHADHAIRLLRDTVDRGIGNIQLDLAALRLEIGDVEGAHAVYRAAAAKGDVEALRALARIHGEAGDLDAALAFAKEAVDRGSPEALAELADWYERMGDTMGAQRIRRFGLTDDGMPATGIIFSPVGPALIGELVRVREHDLQPQLTANPTDWAQPLAELVLNLVTGRIDDISRQMLATADRHIQRVIQEQHSVSLRLEQLIRNGVQEAIQGPPRVNFNGWIGVDVRNADGSIPVSASRTFRAGFGPFNLVVAVGVQPSLPLTEPLVVTGGVDRRRVQFEIEVDSDQPTFRRSATPVTITTAEGSKEISFRYETVSRWFANPPWLWVRVSQAGRTLQSIELILASSNGATEHA